MGKIINLPPFPPRVRKYRPYPRRESFVWAEQQNELVWHLCGLYIRGYKLDWSEGCKKCPAWEEIEHHGRCKVGCRALAEEAIAYVKDATLK